MSNSGVSLKRKQEVGERVKYVLGRYFTSAFPGLSVDQVKPIALALLYYESRLNNTRTAVTGSPDKSFLASSAYKAIIASQDSVKISAMTRAATLVYGVMQVRGSYLVKGGSSTGVSEVERIRPDIASIVCVNAGDSVEDRILGESNLEHAIMAGLAVLQGKYASIPSIMKPDGKGGFLYTRSNLRFPSRISAAVGAYLGLSGSDVNGTTAQVYASSIIGGEAYITANSYDPTAKYPDSGVGQDNRGATQVATGPSTTGAGQDRVTPVDC